jgi:hypothetical protein
VLEVTLCSLETIGNNTRKTTNTRIDNSDGVKPIFRLNPVFIDCLIPARLSTYSNYGISACN